MSSQQLIECVPNFSEGVDMSVIRAITDEISGTEGVRLLDVDPGKATNRTVVTFVGEPEAVIEAAFLAIKMASQLIDMSTHKGEHPRMGATDVCPLIPIANISMEETVQYAEKLGARVGKELHIPIYLYEAAAKKPDRKNLATIRSGEYEGFAKKITDPNWKPDYGPNTFNIKAGATVIGARDFLVAYNVNLNSTSVRRANAIAFDIRENGRIKRKGNKLSGEIERDADGNAIRIPGMLKSVKAIGWYIEEYGVAQISMNLTDINVTSLHEAFDATVQSATNRGIRVTGSELVGLVPKKVLIDTGKHFLRKQNRSVGVSEAQIIHIAVKSLGLDELGPFDPKKKVIEYLLDEDKNTPLVEMDLKAFADETASESPAPGGGSISAYVGALGVSLGTMVANLSSHKRGWDSKWEYFSTAAETGQKIKDELLMLVDEDTAAFNKIMAAFKLPKSTDTEKAQRKLAISDATKYAIEIPLRVMKTAASAYPMLQDMATNGNPASASDAGVGALCVHTAIHGALLNVQINCSGFKEKDYVANVLREGQDILKASENSRDDVLAKVDKLISA